jgi:hypothetical protein
MCLGLYLGLGLLSGLSSSQIAFAEQVACINTAKAAFIYNFLKFTDWPAEAFSSPDAPLVICLHQVAPALEFNVGKLAGRTAQGHPITVLDAVPWSRVGECHMVVFGEDHADRVARVSGPVLTVGQSDGFLEQGGMIALLAENERLVFEISLDNLNRARIHISSQLLSLARNLRRR